MKKNAIATLEKVMPPFSDALREHLMSVFVDINYAKKHFLVKEGQIADKIYFLEKGLVRNYYVDDEGKEVNTWFMKENDFVLSILSFYSRHPSYEYLEALEDCEVTYITYDALQEVYRKFPEFNYVGRVITEHYYMLSELRTFYLRMHSADVRLALLLKDFPTILARIKHKHIASFLGVSPETFSRILAKKK